VVERTNKCYVKCQLTTFIYLKIWGLLENPKWRQFFMHNYELYWTVLLRSPVRTIGRYWSSFEPCRRSERHICTYHCMCIKPMFKLGEGIVHPHPKINLCRKYFVIIFFLFTSFTNSLHLYINLAKLSLAGWLQRDQPITAGANYTIANDNYISF
jgi:hypothetical protein